MSNRDDTTRESKGRRRALAQPRAAQTSSLKGPSPAEAAVSPEQEKYRLLAENAPLGIAVVGREGRYQYLNPKFTELFGYTLDDVPTGQEWFARAYPDEAYRRQVISDWKLYWRESQAGEAEPRVFTVTCKDGAAKVIKFRASPWEGKSTSYCMRTSPNCGRPKKPAERPRRGRLVFRPVNKMTSI